MIGAFRKMNSGKGVAKAGPGNPAVSLRLAALSAEQRSW